MKESFAPAAACRYYALQGAVAAAGRQCEALQAQEAGVRVEIEALGRERYKVGGSWDGGRDELLLSRV